MNITFRQKWKPVNFELLFYLNTSLLVDIVLKACQQASVVYQVQQIKELTVEPFILGS